MFNLTQIKHLDELTARYDALFCDVWGVLHNGIQRFEMALTALQHAKEVGLSVVLITNAPRPRSDIAEQLSALSIPSTLYDRIITSGDVTRDLIAKGPHRIFHLGPKQDMTLYDGLDIEVVEEFEAAGIVCTGFLDDETETPENYAPMLKRMCLRDLPFICANPDIVIEKGNQLLWCAGALARDYHRLGGRTLIAGKPHRPIYEAALQAVCECRGQKVNKSRILAIGDGILTDVKGAEQFGIDILYISGGIHANDYSDEGIVDREKLFHFLRKYGSRPSATMHVLA